MRKSVLTILAVCAAIVGALAIPAAAPAANIATTSRSGSSTDPVPTSSAVA